MQSDRKLIFFYLASYLTILGWSALEPHDYFTWFLEVVPALMGIAVLAHTYQRFPLTRMAYTLIWLHAIILTVGGHYTYAHVPLGDWVRDALGQSRNNYDKLGHLAQGFVPAIIARELFLRLRVVTRRGWLNFIVVSVCLAISAFYELIEWWVAELTGEGAQEFLGTQGYVWDTQSDMFLAMVGAIAALALLSKWHDKQLAALEPPGDDDAGEMGC